MQAEGIGFNYESATRQLNVVADNLQARSQIDNFDYTMLVYGSVATMTANEDSDIDVLVLVEKECEEPILHNVIDSIKNSMTIDRRIKSNCSLTILPLSYYLQHAGFQTFVENGSYVFDSSSTVPSLINDNLDFTSTKALYEIHGHKPEDSYQAIRKYFEIGETPIIRKALIKNYQRLNAALGYATDDLVQEKTTEELLTFSVEMTTDLLKQWENIPEIKTQFEQDYGNMQHHLEYADMLRDMIK